MPAQGVNVDMIEGCGQGKNGDLYSHMCMCYVYAHLHVLCVYVYEHVFMCVCMCVCACVVCTCIRTRTGAIIRGDADNEYKKQDPKM